MESQLPRTHGHHYEPQELSHNPTAMHSGVGGEDEGHQEKHSVLQKVKEKAKKIKNTLKKHGHGHEHGHSHDEYEEDDDEYEEMEQDPEIHGAPIYESEAVRSAARAPGTDLSQHAPGPIYESTAVRSAAREPGIGLGHRAAGPNLEKPSVMAEDRYDSVYSPPVKTFGQWEKEEEEGKHTGYLGGFGAKGINPLPEHKQTEHKQVPISSVQEHGPGLEFSRVPTDTKRIGGGIGRSTGFEEDPHGPHVRDGSTNVQAKAIDPAGKGSEEAAGITPLLQKMRISDTEEQKPKTNQGEKLHTGSHDQFAPEQHDTLNPSNQSSTFAPSPLGHHQNPDSVPKNYDATNPESMPHDTFNPSNQSSTYTEKIMSASAAAASAIAGTTQSAKNVITSKIGQMREQGDDTKPGSGSVTGTASDYAHKVAATVTETLAPVYGKVVGAGSAVTSKVTGMGGEQAHERTENVVQDKGVSVTGYSWAEKLKPGDEDKALSEMITETLAKTPAIVTETVRKPKTEKTEEAPVGGGRGISDIVSDAIHKRAPEESEEKRPMGKVTESPAVAERLGTGGEEKKLENLGIGGGGSGVGVVDRIKGVVGSWLSGQGGDTQINPGTTLAGDEAGGGTGRDADNQGGVGERNLQESSN